MSLKRVWKQQDNFLKPLIYPAKDEAVIKLSEGWQNLFHVV